MGPPGVFSPRLPLLSACIGSAPLPLAADTALLRLPDERAERAPFCRPTIDSSWRPRRASQRASARCCSSNCGARDASCDAPLLYLSCSSSAACGGQGRRAGEMGER